MYLQLQLLGQLFKLSRQGVSTSFKNELMHSVTPHYVTISTKWNKVLRKMQHKLES